MTSPVRIDETHKRALQQLRHEVARASGTQPSQQELLGRSIDFALRHRDAFIRETTWKPMTPAQAKRWLSRTHRLGKWSAEEIDEIVYGDPR